MEKKEEKKAQATGAEVAKNANADALAMQKEIERKTKELQRCLEELERKKTLSNNRTKFLAAADMLEEAQNALNERDDFDSSEYRLSFLPFYSSREVFSISNRVILFKFIEFMKKEISVKVRELENELIKK